MELFIAILFILVFLIIVFGSTYLVTRYLKRSYNHDPAISVLIFIAIAFFMWPFGLLLGLLPKVFPKKTQEENTHNE